MNFYNFLKDNQPFIYKTFKNAVSNNKLSQAYLIKGSDGAPVLDCAKYLAKSIICQDNDGFACDECLDCIRFDEGNYADFMMIDGNKTAIKVGDIEALQLFLSSEPLEKKGKKIYIINLLENSNKESVNALLKTLEEPSENVHAFITTQNEAKLLPTILSRCQILNLLPTDKKIIQEEVIKNDVSREDAELLSSLYGNANTIKELVNDERYLKCKNALLGTLDAFDKSYENALFFVEKEVIPYIKSKEDARLYIDLLSLAFKDILKLSVGGEIILFSKKDLLSRLSNKFKHIEKDYLEIMLTRGKIEINVSLALLLEHIFIYIKENENGNN